MLGKKHTQETKRKIGEAIKRLGLKPPSALGLKRTPETRQKMSVWQVGRKLSEEHKEKLSEAKKKNPVRYWRGKSRPEMQLEKNHNWLGGKSFEPYTIDWTNTLRRSIRERDFHTCQLCKEPQGDIAFDVHHIDYNKKNCNPTNLVTLCRKCHMKTNYNREYWTNYFKVVNEKLISSYV